jgi:flagellar basal-body rod protein FlgG
MMMVHHIMHLASYNGQQQFQVLDKVAQNVGNINTTAYKGVRFEQYLEPDGRLEGFVRTDNTIGQAMITRREMDVAVLTDGYFPVTQPDGTVAYTRDGSFKQGKDGYLYTARGDLLGTGYLLPPRYEKLLIFPDGTIKAEEKKGKRPVEVGKLNLVTFRNPEGLQTIGGNKVMETSESGPPTLHPEPKFAQGKLERSNFSVQSQVDQILRLNGSLIANFRVIKYADDIYRQAVTLRQQ